MSFTPQQSALRITPEIEKYLQTLNSASEITAYLHEQEVQQGLVTRDYYSPDVLIPTPLADAAPRKFARAVTIDGQKHIVEGASELELEKAVTDLYRAAMQPAATTRPAPTQQPRDEAGRFIPDRTQDDPLLADARESLRLEFQQGRIDTATYLAKSGAFDQYLTQRGVSIDSLKETVERAENTKFQQSWEDATQTFLRQTPDWPGGQENLQIAGRLIQENGLIDSPTAETLAKVWQFMKDNSLAVETPEQRAAKEREAWESEIAKANSPSELAAALRISERQKAIRNFRDRGGDR
jgi:hypothetical protein